MICLAPNSVLDPIYYTLVLTYQKQALVIAPHGFEFSDAHLAFLKNYQIKLLSTTFSLVKLPALLGGAVNPGLENARKLVKQLEPEYVVNTHDEQKHARGIVMRIAKTDYPDLSSLDFDSKTRFLNIDNYNRIALALVHCKINFLIF